MGTSPIFQKGNMKTKNAEETINKLIKSGGGIFCIVVAKGGDFQKYFYQEFDCSTKAQLADIFKEIPEKILFSVDENLDKI